MSRFIVTRFTQGSGGKFLSSVIQASNTVDHWSTVLQLHKNQAIFSQLVHHYFDRSFPLDHSLALRNEPHCPYSTDLYSSSYDRGNDVTLEQLLQHAHRVNDVRFLDSWYKNRLMNIVFHKPQIPQFCNNNFTVTITIKTEAEQQWVYQTLWQKHWIEINGRLIYAPNDPEYCHITALPNVLKFNNISRFSPDEKSRILNEIVSKDHTRQWYIDHLKFEEYDSVHGLQNLFVPLRSFFDRDQFIDIVDCIFKKFSLQPVNIDLIDTMRSIWVSKQIALND